MSWNRARDQWVDYQTPRVRVMHAPVGGINTKRAYGAIIEDRACTYCGCHVCGCVVAPVPVRVFPMAAVEQLEAGRMVRRSDGTNSDIFAVRDGKIWFKRSEGGPWLEGLSVSLWARANDIQQHGDHLQLDWSLLDRETEDDLRAKLYRDAPDHDREPARLLCDAPEPDSGPDDDDDDDEEGDKEPAADEDLVFAPVYPSPLRVLDESKFIARTEALYGARIGASDLCRADTDADKDAEVAAPEPPNYECPIRVDPAWLDAQRNKQEPEL